MKPLFGYGLDKKRLRLAWSCSDFAHHEHRTRIGAMICGKWQQLKKVFK